MKAGPEKRRYAWAVGKRLLALLVGAVLLKMVGCDGLFYVPDSTVYSSPIDHVNPAHRAGQTAGELAESVDFTSSDGTRLHAWFLRASPEAPARGTVIHYHGNAQNLTSHAYLSSWLTEHGLNVFIFDYRGYGRSEGRPSRRGVHEDGVAALAYLRSRADVDPDRIVVLGQSLGGAVALAALGEGSREGVRAIAILNSFLYYRDVANGALGGSVLTYPVAWLAISNAHSPGLSIAKLDGIPKLVVHGTADPVVGIEHGRAIYEALPAPRAWLELENGGHDLSLPHERQRLRAELVRFYLDALGA